MNRLVSCGRTVLRVLQLGFLIIGATATGPATYAGEVITPASRDQFQIYLLMGQSNMAGRDTRQLSSQATDPRVLALNEQGQWAVARDPIFPQRGRTLPGAGPGIPFAEETRKALPNITIGLVPCAVGGTSLNHWVKGGDLYARTLEMAKVAAKSGVIAGVLWHQGESDTTDAQHAATYAARLAQMFTDLRRDLDSPDLPIVVGQIGSFLPKEKFPYADAVRTAIRHVSDTVPHVGFADSDNLGDRGDNLHFSADAQREFGRRYAAAMLRVRAEIPHVKAKPTTTVELWPDGKMPGKGASGPEADLPVRGDDVQRTTNVSQPTLSFFPAATHSTATPAFVVCPGGGYSYVVCDKEGSEIARWLNSLGIAAVVLKYRVPHNRDGALQDVQRALSITRAKAAEWHIDPRQIGVMGFSAGGNLAAKASTQFGHLAYAIIDSIDQASCRPDFAVLVYPAYLEKDGALSADLDLTAQIPPTLIVHNEDDQTFVGGSKLYHAALDRIGAPNQFLLYATGGHGYGLQCTRDARAWPDAAVRWLKGLGLHPAQVMPSP